MLFERVFSRISFLKHSKNYFIGNIVTKAFVLITIPIFTRLLTPEEYGLVSIYLALSSVFLVILPLNLHASVRQKYLKDKENDFPGFLGTIQLTILLFMAILIVVLFFLEDRITHFFDFSPLLFRLAILTAIISVFLEIYTRLLLAQNNSSKYSIISIVKSFLELTISVLLIYIIKEDKYIGRIYGHILGFIFITFYCTYQLYKISNFTFYIRHLKYALIFCIPLIPHFISQFALAQFDRVIINQMVGSYETGIYSLAYNIGLIMQIIVISANNAWIPSFYENLKNKQYLKINNALKLYTKTILFIGLGLAYFSKEILLLISDRSYYEALDIIPIIILSGVFVFFYTIYANYSFYENKTLYISIGTIIAGLFNISINYLLIPKYGYKIAAYTTLLSYVLLFFLHYLNSKYIIKQNVLHISFLIKTFFTFLFFFLFLFIINRYLKNYNFLISMLKLFSLFIYFLVVLRKDIKIILKMIA